MYAIISVSLQLSPPKPEAQFPEAVPPPSVHSVLVVHTPCFTLISPVMQTSLGNWTMLNKLLHLPSPGEKRNKYRAETGGYNVTFNPVVRHIITNHTQGQSQTQGSQYQSSFHSAFLVNSIIKLLHIMPFTKIISRMKLELL